MIRGGDGGGFLGGDWWGVKVLGAGFGMRFCSEEKLVDCLGVHLMESGGS